ncbi:MAG: hypothetical protein AAGA75_04840, partial [Cyanobacteria bacterium P01_E01_bin.6]
MISLEHKLFRNKNSDAIAIDTFVRTWTFWCRRRAPTPKRPTYYDDSYTRDKYLDVIKTPNPVPPSQRAAQD